MKKAIYSLTLFLFLFAALNSFAVDKELSPLSNLMTVTMDQGNLPDYVSDANGTRGAGMNSDYVFIASRQNSQNNVYYWDINNPGAEPEVLDNTGVSGGYFTLADMTVAGDHIFACNMVFSGGEFKVYHWNGVESTPEVLISYNPTVRLGDAFSVIGDPSTSATLVASGHGTTNYYAWDIENGELVNTDPEVVTLGNELNANFSRVTEVPALEGEQQYYLVSGPGFGPILIDDTQSIVEEMASDFFPGWAMYAHIFYYEGVRYMAYMHVNGVAGEEENTLYILDISDGATPLEAIQNLGTGVFADAVVHSRVIGTNANLNASVSTDLAMDMAGNMYVFGFAAGNGFVLDKIGDNVADFLTLPVVENFEGIGEETPLNWVPEGWSNIDNDGDGYLWEWESFENTQTGETETYMLSFSWGGEEIGALTPDNWLVTPEIYIEPGGANIMTELMFTTAQWAENPDFKLERYEVLVSTTDMDPGSFTMIWEETFTEDSPQYGWEPRMLDLSEYQGETVYIAFRHYGTTDFYGMGIEYFELKNISDETPVADLTLNVQMLVWNELGKFDPANDFVDVAGEFNDWGAEGQELVLTAVEDDNMTYTITIPDLFVDSTYNFKFRINGSWDDETAEFPFGGDPRTVTISSDDNEYTYWYNDDTPSGIDQVIFNESLLFPNPANSFVEIKGEQVIESVIIKDLAGRAIKILEVQNDNIVVDTSNLNNGIYIFQLNIDNGAEYHKVEILK